MQTRCRAAESRLRLKIWALPRVIYLIGVSCLTVQGTSPCKAFMLIGLLYKTLYGEMLSL